MKTLLLFVLVALPFLISGCGVKEGAEFYALKKQDESLTESVSNLQAQVDELVAENNRLRSAVATNSVAIGLLIQDEREHEVRFEKFQKQFLKK